MTGRMRIDFTPQEGAVIRLIGLIERRGFQVRRLDMNEDAGGSHASLTVDLDARDPTRSLDTLDRQLRRVHGVHTISTLSPVAEAVS